MTSRAFLAATLVLASAAPIGAQTALAPGIWTNTEDAYFAEEEGRRTPDWIGLEVDADGRWRRIDAFGAPQEAWHSDEIAGLAQRSEGGWQIGGSELRRANRFTCWISARKFAGKPDGSPDWNYARQLPVFDQGGRVTLAGEGDAPDVTFRLRNVTWAKGSSNRPSLVLYVHKNDPVRAESYSWASPDAAMIGINLRWVQGSCSRVEGD